MKKVVVVLLCCALICGAFAGCGAQPTNEQEEAFRTWIGGVASLETAGETYSGTVISMVLLNSSAQILDIPKSIFENDDWKELFTLNDEIGESMELTLYNATEPVDVSIDILNDKISDVSYSFASDSTTAAVALSMLSEEYGTPSDISLNDVSSNLEEIEAELYLDSDLHAGITWEVTDESGNEYSLLFQAIIKEYAGLVSLTVF